VTLTLSGRIMVTVTKSPCAWCGRAIECTEGPGRPRRFCRRSCRQRDYEARRRAADHGLDEAEIIVTRTRLEDLADHIWVLRCAVEDVERDLVTARTSTDYRDALNWLLKNARPLLGEPG
jgi:hypothetical protein